MPNPKGKKRVTATLDRDLVKFMDDQTDNRSEFLNDLLRNLYENYEEAYERKLLEEKASIDKQLETLRIRKEQKRRESEERYQKALNELESLNLEDYTSESLAKKVYAVSQKYGLTTDQTTELAQKYQKPSDNKI